MAKTIRVPKSRILVQQGVATEIANTEQIPKKLNNKMVKIRV